MVLSRKCRVVAILCLTIGFCYCLPRVYGQTGESEENVLRLRASAPDVVSSFNRLGKSGRKAFDQIAAGVEQTGRMLSYEEFMDRLVGFNEPLSIREYFALFYIYAKCQRTQLSAADIAEEIAGWNEAIDTVDISYTVAFVGGSQDGLTRKTRFVLDGPNMLSDSTKTWEGSEREPRREVHAYDGTQYERAAGKSGLAAEGWKNSRNVIGHIQPIDSLARFHDLYNPLVLQCLLDSPARFSTGSDSPADTMRNLWAFEYTPPSEGDQPLTLASNHSKYVFSLNKGLAIESHLLYRYDYSEQARRLAHDPSYVTLQADDWFEIAGFWLPKRMARVSHRGDGGAETAFVSIEDVAINEPVDASCFSNVIPSGALVSRPGIEKAHRIDSAGGIEQSIDSQLSSSFFSWRRIVVVANTLVVLALTVAIARNYYKK